MGKKSRQKRNKKLSLFFFWHWCRNISVSVRHLIFLFSNSFTFFCLFSYILFQKSFISFVCLKITKKFLHNRKKNNKCRIFIIFIQMFRFERISHCFHFNFGFMTSGRLWKNRQTRYRRNYFSYRDEQRFQLEAENRNQAKDKTKKNSFLII